MKSQCMFGYEVYAYVLSCWRALAYFFCGTKHTVYGPLSDALTTQHVRIDSLNRIKKANTKVHFLD